MHTTTEPDSRPHRASDSIDCLAAPTLSPSSVAELLATTDTPYRWAPAWAAAGWSPIPVTRSKLPIAGVTGWEGAEVDQAKATELAALYPRRNVALRMRRGWLAIDVDAYHAGLDTIRLAMQRWGALPDTISSTNREDGSGIWYYRCPAELVTVGNLDREVGKGVDLIQRHHRFAVVSGTHASGRRYRTSTGGIWQASECAQLPDRWAEGLRKAKLAEVTHASSPTSDGTSRPVAEWRGSPSRRLVGLLDRVAESPEGERNGVLFWASCRAFGEVLDSAPELPSAELLAELLRRAAARAGLGDAESLPTIGSARRTVGR